MGPKDADRKADIHDIPKLIKMVLAAPRLALRHCVVLGLVGPSQDVTGCEVMSSVWGMIFQWDSTIKVSIELPVATRHRPDMTEKLLKVTLNQNKQQQQQQKGRQCTF